MAHTEIEPWAAKTLLFLRSNAENSLEDMRTMLMEFIHQKYTGRKTFKLIPPLAHSESWYEKSKGKEMRSGSSDHKSKSQALESYSSINIPSPESFGSVSDSSSENSEMVILEDDLSCAICKQITSASWNQFIECSECHLLYHQQCHVPPIPDSDINDPRTVWYCRNCTKTISKPKASSVSSSSTSSQSSKSSSSKIASRTSTSSPSFGSKPFGGVSATSKKSSGSKSSQATSNKVTPNLNMASADKRLQNMKKKAALKQDKRQK